MTGAAGKLARVTYLPGVTPPAAPAAEAPAPTAVSSREAQAPAAGTVRRRAADLGLRALTRRDLSRWELEKTLREKGLEADEVTDELERLTGLGLIDDAALADLLVRTRHERKGLGRFALAAELRARHIDQQHIDAALAQIGDDDEQRTARDLALKRADSLRGVDWQTATRRLSSYLTRKGYSADTVRGAVREALADQSRPGSAQPGAALGVHFE